MSMKKTVLKICILSSLFAVPAVCTGMTAGAEDIENPEIFRTVNGISDETEETAEIVSETEETTEVLKTEETTEISETESASENTSETTVSDESGSSFELNSGSSDGWQVVDGKRYYYVSGKAVTGIYKISGLEYIFDETGAQMTGWQKLGDIYYYFDLQTGESKPGERVIDGEYYLFNMKGQLALGWRTVNGKRVYYSPETGKKVTGWIDYFDNRYYSDKTDGKKTGWFENNSKKYYLDKETGQMNTGLSTIDNSVYYFDNDGVMQTGIQKVDDNIYSFDNSGKMQKGFVVINNRTYYFDNNGNMVKGFVNVGGSDYYFNTDGTMATGVQTVNGKLYYFDLNGKMLKDTFKGEYKIGKDGVAIKMTKSQQQAKNVLDKVGWNLKKAYEYSYSMPYYGHTADMPQDDKPGVEWYASYGFTNYKGNCYVMASVFCRLAEMLGYDVKQISGSVPLRAGGYGPHSWTEIVVDGKTYVCDPDFQNETKKNGYLINYGQSGTWRYKKEKVMN